MTTDDDRISYLADSAEQRGDALEGADGSRLGALRSVLAAPALWEDPSVGLRDSLVAAVVAQARADGAAAAGRTARPRRLMWVRPALLGAAAASAAAFGIVAISNDTPAAADATMVITGTELAPNSGGTARFTSTQSGVKIELDVAGLPRRDGTEFYQAWLKSVDGGRLVPIGSFHEGNYVVLWAGVSYTDYPILTVSRESVAGPQTIEQGTSGEIVAMGAVTP